MRRSYSAKLTMGRQVRADKDTGRRAVDIETTRVGLGCDVDGRAGMQAIESQEQRVAVHPRDSSFPSVPRKFVPLLLGPLDSPHASPFTRPTTLGSSHTAPAAHARIITRRDFIWRHASLPTDRTHDGSGVVAHTAAAPAARGSDEIRRHATPGRHV
jgi:hypothetical protein